MTLRSFFHNLMFMEAKRLVVLGRKRILQAEDMPPLPGFLNPRTLPFSESEIDRTSGKKLIWSLFRAARAYVFPAYLLAWIFIALNLTKPILVNSFIESISNIQVGVIDWKSFSLALLLGIVSFGASIHLQHYFLRSLHCVQIFVNALTRMIYKHSLYLTQKSRGQTSLGDVVNHMGSDTDTVSDLPITFGELQMSGFTLIGGTILLVYYMGPTALLSITLLILLLPLTKRVASQFSKLDEELMHHRDERVTLMSQILNAIRVVKYFAWEKSVYQEVEGVRKKEISARMRLAKAEAFATLSYIAISTAVLFTTFWLHTLQGKVLSPALVFTVISIFALLDEPLSHLSELVSRLMAAVVSAGRICDFLKREKLNSTLGLELNHDREPVGLQAENLSVKYFEQSQLALENIFFDLLPGESLAIIGSVGSGKTTLLHTLLREIPLQSGVLRFVDQTKKLAHPKIAYVPQEAFIMNGSLKENILFGEKEDGLLLNRSLDNSCLRVDLDQLPAGLFTEIGEKGVNLSGGQKQRVSLARAIMQQPTLVLLDDPLSAVDTRTESLLVENLIFGEWKSITRVVVTHRLAHLHRFSKILWLEKGAIKEVGSFEELMLRSESFRQLFQSAQDTDGNPRLMTVAASESPAAQENNSAQSVSRVTEDEDRAIGAVRSGVYWDYILALGGPKYRYLMIFLLMGTSVLASLMPLAQKSWLALSGNLQTGKLAPNGSPWQSWASESGNATLVYGAIGLFSLLIILGNRLLWMFRGVGAGRQMHDTMLRSVLKAPLRFFDSTPTGRVVQRFSRDVEAIDIQLQWSFETTVRCLVNIAISLFLIVSVLPLMLFVVGPVLFLYYRLQVDYRRPAREAKRLDSISRSPRFAHFKETLQGLMVIRGFGKTDLFLELFFQKIEHGQRMFYGHIMLNRWFSSRIPLLGGFIASSTGVGIVYYTQLGSLSPGMAGLLTVYALSLWEYLNWAVRIFAEVESRMTSVERLKFYSSLEPERDVTQDRPIPSAWPVAGEVVFDQVKIRYASHLPPVLKGISFRIPAGSRAGIIGRTGSGKSTLLQALFRCMEVDSGEIRIDGENIAHIGLERLRRSIAIIPQDPTLFIGTLRSNLDRFQEYTDEEIWAALAKARLDQFVKTLSGGLASEVKENGANFSQGQRQLLCLARALLLEAKIVVMDEATASVDAKTDALVQEVIRESCKGVTMLIIAHRLGTVADCDLVLEVREGKIFRQLDLKKKADTVPVC